MAWVLVAWWFAWVAIMAVAPIVGLIGMALWASLAHVTVSAGRALAARPDRRRAARAMLLALASPWHVLRALALGVLGVASGLVISSCLLICLLVLARLLGLTGVPFDATAAGIGALTGLCVWHGLFGEAVRGGTVMVLGAATSWRYGRLAYGALGLIIGLAALYLAGVTPVTFAPIGIDGLGWLNRWQVWFD